MHFCMGARRIESRCFVVGVCLWWGCVGVCAFTHVHVLLRVACLSSGVQGPVHSGCPYHLFGFSSIPFSPALTRPLVRGHGLL